MFSRLRIFSIIVASRSSETAIVSKTKIKKKKLPATIVPTDPSSTVNLCALRTFASTGRRTRPSRILSSMRKSFHGIVAQKRKKKKPKSLIFQLHFTRLVFKSHTFARQPRLSLSLSLTRGT